MHWRIYGSALALLSFAVVCFSGLLQGHSFASAIKQSLLAMVIGGLTGVLAAVAVRYVVREEANHKDQEVEEELSPSKGAGDSVASSTVGTDAADSLEEPVSQGAGSAVN
ncbi:MAG: hypothetical protein GWP05_02530 [Anaerolineaceae bacterium]|nr:hypothetical protein [Anaerolineaceae bacterium]